MWRQEVYRLHNQWRNNWPWLNKRLRAITNLFGLPAWTAADIPLTPEMDMFNSRASISRLVRNFLDMRFTCEPESSRAWEGFRELLLSDIWTMAVDRVTRLLSTNSEACVAVSKLVLEGFEPEPLSDLLDIWEMIASLWRSVLCFFWHTLHWPNLHLLGEREEGRKQLR